MKYHLVEISWIYRIYYCVADIFQNIFCNILKKIDNLETWIRISICLSQCLFTDLVLSDSFYDLNKSAPTVVHSPVHSPDYRAMRTYSQNLISWWEGSLMNYFVWSTLNLIYSRDEKVEVLESVGSNSF